MKLLSSWFVEEYSHRHPPCKEGGGKEAVVSRSKKQESHVGGSKVEFDIAREAYGLGDAPFSAIVKVDEPNYVPDCVTLRVRISPEIFTAQISPPDLELLEKDPRVVSISPSRLLQVG
jgi:hypothetical protein